MATDALQYTRGQLFHCLDFLPQRLRSNCPGKQQHNTLPNQHQPSSNVGCIVLSRRELEHLPRKRTNFCYFKKIFIFCNARSHKLTKSESYKRTFLQKKNYTLYLSWNQGVIVTATRKSTYANERRHRRRSEAQTINVKNRVKIERRDTKPHQHQKAVI